MTDTFAIPELTRGLRSFAAPASLGPAHDRFFSPLLSARRLAMTASDWTSRLSAFDAERLEATIRATLGTFAAEEFPSSAPDRRALAAHLDEACGSLFDALTVLGRAQARVREAPDADRAAAWGDWVRVLRMTFAAADRGWEQVRALVRNDRGRGKRRRAGKG